LSVISVAPLIFASFIFGKANVILWNTMLLAMNFWQGKSAEEIISLNNYMDNISYWSSFIVSGAIIYLISLMRYLFHLVMRKIMDKKREDGKTSGYAPLIFFIFHTSGLALLFGIYILGFSVINKFFPRNPFTTIYNFFENNLLWKLATGAVCLLFVVKYVESNTQIMLEIYKDKRLVSIVRKTSFVITSVLFVVLPVAGLFGGFWLLNKASMMTDQ
jgi:hypothetical protein